MVARKLVAASAIVTLFGAGTAYASDISCTHPVRLNGEAKNGNDFIHALPNKLAFALKAERHAPPNPYGWTISIYPAADPDDDFVWPANPPYRGLNVRDLTLIYGETAERVVAYTPRIFAFYTDVETNAQAQSWIRQQLWGKEPNPPAELPPPQGNGEFKIDSSVFGTAGSTKIIASMKFHVTLCLGGD